MHKIKTGLYKHFKGKFYEVLGTARHSETLEELVVYKAIYGKKELWVRPFSMFFDKIENGGKTLKRFKFVKLK
jgi:hypothetical protein